MTKGRESRHPKSKAMLCKAVLVAAALSASAWGQNADRCHDKENCTLEPSVLLQTRKNKPAGCVGTFIDEQGTTTQCQYALDNHWAVDCSVLATWKASTCRSYCPGTFVDAHGEIQACQKAIDLGWGGATDCAAVSTWKDATCSDSIPDIVVVGGGLFGSLVAAKLSEQLSDKNILLLEAGKPSHYALGGRKWPSNSHGETLLNKDFEKDAEFMASPFTQYDMPGNYNLGMQCSDPPFSCDDSWGSAYPAYQCKVLGGCGVKNGALMQLPAAATFAKFPAGWKYADLKPYMDKVMAEMSITSLPSTEGQHHLPDAGANYMRSVFEELGFQDPQDANQATTTPEHPRNASFGIPTVTSVRGERQSTASKYLPEAIARPNFKLRTQVEVAKILHTQGSAVGIAVKDTATGRSETIRMKQGGRIVMSSGAFGTPRVLLASGLDGKGTVGKGLSDHAIKQRTYTVPGWPTGAWQIYTNGVMDNSATNVKLGPALDQYKKNRTGPLTQYGPTITAFFKKPGSPGDAAENFDVELFMNPMWQAHSIDLLYGLMRPTCSNTKIVLNSQGNLEFDCPAGGCAPVDPGENSELYLGCEEDRWRMKYAMDLVEKKLLEKGLTLQSEFPKTNAWSFNHWVGTCAMGYCSSPDTLLVEGTSNVHVADASMVPTQIHSHPALSFMAMGHKAADVVALEVLGGGAAH